MAVPQRHLSPTPDKAAARPGRHLQVAPRPSRHLMSRVGWAAAITVVAALFALALFHSVIVDRQTTLDDLKEELEDVRAVNDRLRLNVSRAEAPDRVVAEARYRLGMVEPDRRIYLPPVESDEGGTR